MASVSKFKRDLIDINSVDKFDTTVSKNKFSAKWMKESEVDDSGEPFSNYIRKHKLDAYAWCEYCDTVINYASNGKKVLKQHSRAKSHKENKRRKASEGSLPAAFHALHNKVSGALTSTASNAPVQKPVGLPDRISHQEALICSFLAEHSLSLSLTPHLIELSRELARDPKALQNLKMERQTATYKLRYGLSALEHKRLLTQMKATPFSLNLDESTSKGNKKRVLNVLVCFFSDELHKCSTQLYCSVEMTVVNADTVFEAVMGKLRADGIPIQSNLVSILSDSAAYMRGVHNGFHARMKEVIPHLLDIDGDVCHHVHNVSKKFTWCLDEKGHLSHHLDDLFRDFDLSADLKKDLLDICDLLNVSALVPIQRAGHRWMSIYDASLRFLDIVGPLTVFYFAWLSVDEKKQHSDLITSLFAPLKKVARTKLYSIIRRLQGKSLSTLGLARKKRIASKLFASRDATLMLAYTITSIFPKFKSFIVAFQTESPMVHKLYDEVVGVLKSFLACFMKHEVINSASNLDKLKMDGQNLLPLKDVFCGSKAKDILQRTKNTTFLKTLQEAYKTTASYMLDKLPHRNKTLASLSSLDPALHGHSLAAAGLQSLISMFPMLIKGHDKDTLLSLASDLQVAKLSIEETRLDKWWDAVLQVDKFSPLAPVIKACLSIFTGPRVEASFSMMNNIITTTSNRMAIKTYEAIQKQKYYLLSLDRSSVQAFHRKDIVFSPVDPSLVYHMQTAYARSQTLKISDKKPAFKSKTPKRSTPLESKTTSLPDISSSTEAQTCDIEDNVSQLGKASPSSTQTNMKRKADTCQNETSTKKKPCTKDIRAFFVKKM